MNVQGFVAIGGEEFAIYTQENSSLLKSFVLLYDRRERLEYTFLIQQRFLPNYHQVFGPEKDQKQGKGGEFREI